MSDSRLLDRLRQMSKVDPNLASPEQTQDEESSERAGVVGKVPPLGVILEWEDGNSETILYASIVSPICYDPSLGISFVFEGKRRTDQGTWEDGPWLVSIRGNNLQPVRNHLSWGRRESVRVNCQTVLAIQIDKLPV